MVTPLISSSRIAFLLSTTIPSKCWSIIVEAYIEFGLWFDFAEKLCSIMVRILSRFSMEKWILSAQTK